jgi:hypothetical protein
MVEAAGYLAIAVYWLVGVPLGGILGAVTVRLRRLWSAEHATKFAG